MANQPTANKVLPKARQKNKSLSAFRYQHLFRLDCYTASTKGFSAFVILVIFSSGLDNINIPPSAIPERCAQLAKPYDRTFKF